MLVVVVVEGGGDSATIGFGWIKIFFSFVSTLFHNRTCVENSINLAEFMGDATTGIDLEKRTFLHISFVVDTIFSIYTSLI